MDSKTLSVLIADDEITVLEALASVLTRLGYEVVASQPSSQATLQAGLSIRHIQ